MCNSEEADRIIQEVVDFLEVGRHQNALTRDISIRDEVEVTLSPLGEGEVLVSEALLFQGEIRATAHYSVFAPASVEERQRKHRSERRFRVFKRGLWLMGRLLRRRVRFLRRFRKRGAGRDSHTCFQFYTKTAEEAVTVAEAIRSSPVASIFVDLDAQKCDTTHHSFEGVACEGVVGFVGPDGHGVTFGPAIVNGVDRLAADVGVKIEDYDFWGEIGW